MRTGLIPLYSYTKGKPDMKRRLSSFPIAVGTWTLTLFLALKGFSTLPLLQHCQPEISLKSHPIVLMHCIQKGWQYSYVPESFTSPSAV